MRSCMRGTYGIVSGGTDRNDAGRQGLSDKRDAVRLNLSDKCDAVSSPTLHGSHQAIRTTLDLYGLFSETSVRINTLSNEF